MSAELSIALNCITIVCGIVCLVNSMRMDRVVPGVLCMLAGFFFIGLGVFLIAAKVGVGA